MKNIYENAWSKLFLCRLQIDQIGLDTYLNKPNFSHISWRLAVLALRQEMSVQLKCEDRNRL